MCARIRVGGPADRILRELLRAALSEALAELSVAWWEGMGVAARRHNGPNIVDGSYHLLTR